MGVPAFPTREISLAARVGMVVPLNDVERKALDELMAARPIVFVRDQKLLEADAPMQQAYLLTGGWAMWHEDLPDGSRQIFDFVLAGDIVGLGALSHERLCRKRGGTVNIEAPISVTALTRVTAVPIGREAIDRLFEHHPELGAELLALTDLHRLIGLRRRLVSATRRTARARLVDLLLELWQRQRAVGLDGASGLDLPISQVVLAELLGLTPVHVSRVLAQLREDGFLSVETHGSRRIVFHDVAALRAIAGTFGR